MRGKLIVFEGLDSSGKKTQVGLLEKKLKDEGKNIETMAFPTYQSTKLGELVSRYLKGDFGAKEEIKPEVTSMFYAIDRYQFKDEIRKKLEKGITLILDRYIAANIYQAAKAEGEERFVLWEWIKTVESRLPQADIIIFLDVLPEVTQKLFAKREVKNVLIEKGGKDIHEADKAYQERVRQLYLEIAKKEGWIVIECCKDGELRAREDIHEEIFKKLKEKGAF